MKYFNSTLSKADIVKLLKPVRLLEATKATEAHAQMTLEAGMWSKAKKQQKKFGKIWVQPGIDPGTDCMTKWWRK